MTRRGESGFSLVVLMAGITITLIFMSAAVPAWKYVMQDDKEQELLFRGAQIADSIGRYQKKNGGALPVSLEVLVKGKFLRKAYKDPMIRDGKWRFIRQGEALAPVRTAPGTGTGPTTTTTTTTTTMPQQSAGLMGPTGTGPGSIGGFIGVASRSTQKSLRVMNGAKTYDTWLFIAGRQFIVGKIPTPPGGVGPLGGSPQPSAAPSSGSFSR